MATYPNPGNQGTQLNTVTFPELYDLVQKNFVTLENMVKPKARSLFIEDMVGQGEGNTKRYDEYDVKTFGKAKREGQGTTAAAFGIGYNVTITAKRLGMKAEVTWEDRRYNRYRKVGGDLVSLSHFIPQRMELDLTHRFTFASSTSYTDMDGDSVTISMGDTLALASGVHTVKHSSTTYSNRISGDPLFSAGGLEAAEALMTTDILSNFGEKRVMNFNTIVTGPTPSVVNAVGRLMKSSADASVSNSGVTNVYTGKYTHVVLDYLATTAAGAPDSTKKNWWFVVANDRAGSVGNGWQAYLAIWEPANLVSPEEGMTKDGDRDVWSFHTRGTYGIAVLSGRGVICSLPTS